MANGRDRDLHPLPNTPAQNAWLWVKTIGCVVLLIALAYMARVESPPPAAAPGFPVGVHDAGAPLEAGWPG